MDEKRKFTRVSFAIQAQVEWQGKNLAGEVANLSLRGMLVKVPEPIPVGQKVAVTLRLVGSSSDLRVRLEGHVVRVAPEGIGLEIEQMDLDSFIHLRGIIAYNSGDANRVDEEFGRYIKQRGERPA
jgi:hypothetical protein